MIIRFLLASAYYVCWMIIGAIVGSMVLLLLWEPLELKRVTGDGLDSAAVGCVIGAYLSGAVSLAMRNVRRFHLCCIPGGIAIAVFTTILGLDSYLKSRAAIGEPGFVALGHLFSAVAFFLLAIAGGMLSGVGAARSRTLRIDSRDDDKQNATARSDARPSTRAPYNVQGFEHRAVAPGDSA